MTIHFPVPARPFVNYRFENTVWVWDGVAWYIDRSATNMSLNLTPAAQAELVYRISENDDTVSLLAPDLYGNTYVMAAAAPFEPVELFVGGVHLVLDDGSGTIGDFTVDRPVSEIVLLSPAPRAAYVQVRILVPPSRAAIGSIDMNTLLDFDTDWSQDPPVPGVQDGTNTDFELYVDQGGSPALVLPSDPAELAVFVDGVRQRGGLDYTVSGSTLEMVVAPREDSAFWALWYAPGPALGLPSSSPGYLEDDGSGNLSWTTPAGALPPDAVGFLSNNGAGSVVWKSPFPSNAAGVLTNNGAGSLSWAPPAGGGGDELPADAAGFLLNDGVGGLSWGDPLPGDAPGYLANNGSGTLVWVQPFPADAAGVLTNNGAGSLSWNPLDLSIYETIVDSEAGDAARMRWMGEYAIGASYVLNDVARDGEWLMIANKATTDRPAPQPSGDPVFDRNDAPSWASLTQPGRVAVGTRYQVEVSGWFDAIEVWSPANANDEGVLVGMLDNDTGRITTLAAQVTLPSAQWTRVYVEPLPIAAGRDITVFLAKTSTSAATVDTALWARAADGPAAPASGEYRYDPVTQTLMISKLDDGGVSRAGVLNSLTAGAEIASVYPAEPNRSETFATNGLPNDEGSYVSYSVAPISIGPWGAPYAGLVCELSTDALTAASTGYVREVSWWPGNQPSWADAEGVLLFNGAAQAGVQDHGFGVRARFQEAYVSPDWDLLAAGVGGGGGASAAAGVFVGDAPPTSPSAGDLWYSSAAPVGLFIYYDDGDSLQWIQTNGSAGGGGGGDLSGGNLTFSYGASFTNAFLNTPASLGIAPLVAYRLRSEGVNRAALEWRAISATDQYLDLNLNLGGVGLRLRSDDGAQDATLSNMPAVAPDDDSIITRERGDTRYAMSPSDARLKVNIEPMPDTTWLLRSLRFSTFEWALDDRDPKPAGLQYGIVAQDWELLAPSTVLGRGDALRRMDLLNVVGIMGRALQSALDRIDALEKDDDA